MYLRQSVTLGQPTSSMHWWTWRGTSSTNRKIQSSLPTNHSSVASWVNQSE